jgi:hypothetical protein
MQTPAMELPVPSEEMKKICSANTYTFLKRSGSVKTSSSKGIFSPQKNLNFVKI